LGDYFCAKIYIRRKGKELFLMDNDGNNPLPKIQGISMPVGSSNKRKQESPEQRSANINAQNHIAEPVQKVINETKTTKHIVTQEEIDAFRKKRSKKRIFIISGIAALVLIVGAVAIIIANNIKHKKYQEYSGTYNNDLPITIQDHDVYYLINQSGKKISGDYDYIDSFESGTSLASKVDGEKVSYQILSASGEILFETENMLTKHNLGKNYLMLENGSYYLLGANGDLVSREPVILPYDYSNLTYYINQNDYELSVYDSDGNKKFTVKKNENVDNISFSVAKGKYDNGINYCLISQSTPAQSNTNIVYNCESGKVVKDLKMPEESKTIDKRKLVFNSADGQPIINSSDKCYYFYEDDLFYETNGFCSESASVITTKVDGVTKYLDAQDMQLKDEFPTHTLISQKKFDITTMITADCTDYQEQNQLELVKFCGKIYYKNKLLTLDSSYSYQFLPDQLATYLHNEGKNYIIRSKSVNLNEIYDIDKKSPVSEIGNFAHYFGDYYVEKSSFVQIDNDTEKAKYYNLITGAVVEAERSEYAMPGNNYIAIEKEDGIHYYNKEAKEIYIIKRD